MLLVYLAFSYKVWLLLGWSPVPVPFGLWQFIEDIEVSMWEHLFTSWWLGNKEKGQEANFPPCLAPAALTSPHWASSPKFPALPNAAPWGWGKPLTVGLWWILSKPLLWFSVLLIQQVCCEDAILSLSDWLLKPFRAPQISFSFEITKSTEGFLAYVGLIHQFWLYGVEVMPVKYKLDVKV